MIVYVNYVEGAIKKITENNIDVNKLTVINDPMALYKQLEFLEISMKKTSSIVKKVNEVHPPKNSV